ncbi:hypothetical protein ACTTAL_19125 (plasmid) [Rhodobacter capsulatus]
MGGRPFRVARPTDGASIKAQASAGNAAPELRPRTPDRQLWAAYIGHADEHVRNLQIASFDMERANGGYRRFLQMRCRDLTVGSPPSATAQGVALRPKRSALTHRNLLRLGRQSECLHRHSKGLMRAAVVVEADPVVDDAVGEVETTPPRSEPFQPHNRSIYARFWRVAKRCLTKGKIWGVKRKYLG